MHMYFFNFKKLVEHLRAGRDTERETYYYLLAYLICAQLGRLGELQRPAQEKDSYMVLGFTVLGCIVSFLALRTLYFANGGDNGKKFVSRLLALSWVASIQYLIVIISMAVVAAAAMYIAQAGWIAIYILPGTLLITAVYFFVKVLNGIKEVNRPLPESSGQ